MIIGNEYKITALTGENGNDVKIKYSDKGEGSPTDSSSGWHDDYREETDDYMCMSTDGGLTWGEAMRFRGESGADPQYIRIIATGGVILKGNGSLTLKVQAVGFTADSSKYEWTHNGVKVPSSNGEITVTNPGVYYVTYPRTDVENDYYEDYQCIVEVSDGNTPDIYFCELSMAGTDGDVTVNVYKNNNLVQSTLYYKDFYGSENSDANTAGSSGIIKKFPFKIAGRKANKHKVQIFADSKYQTLLTTGFVSVGDKGDSGRSYWITGLSSYLVRQKNGTYSEKQISVQAFEQIGSTGATSYNGRIKIYTTTDGSEWVKVYESSKNESSATYPSIADQYPEGLRAIKVELYEKDNGSLLDSDIVSIVNESKDGDNGIIMSSPTSPSGTYEGQLGFYNGQFFKWSGNSWIKISGVVPTDDVTHFDFDIVNNKKLVIDNSGNKNHASNSGVKTSVEINGKCGVFNKSQIVFKSPINNNAFTISFTIKLTKLDNQGLLYSKDGISISIENRKFRINTGLDHKYFDTVLSIAEYCVTFMFNSNKCILYIDSEKQGEMEITLPNVSKDFCVGYDIISDKHLYAYMGDFLIYNRELSSEEICGIYLSQGNISKKYFVSDYNFDMIDDDNVVDHTEKASLLSKWRTIYKQDKVTNNLPTSNVSVDGEYKVIISDAELCEIVESEDITAYISAANAIRSAFWGNNGILLNMDENTETNISLDDLFSTYAEKIQVARSAITNQMSAKASAISVSLENPFCQIPADENDNPITYDWTDNAVQCFYGVDPLKYTSSTLKDGYFTVTTKGNNITPGAIDTTKTTEDGNIVYFSNVSGITNKTAQITYTITGQINGKQFTIYSTQKFSKVERGADGKVYRLNTDISTLVFDVNGDCKSSKINIDVYEGSANAETKAYQCTVKVFQNDTEVKTFTGDSHYEYEVTNDSPILFIAYKTSESGELTFLDQKDIQILKEVQGPKGDTVRGSKIFEGTLLDHITDEDIECDIGQSVIEDDIYRNEITRDEWVCSEHSEEGKLPKWKYGGRSVADLDDNNIFRFFTPNTPSSGLVGNFFECSKVVGETPIGDNGEYLHIKDKGMNRNAESCFIPYNRKVKIEKEYTYRYSCFVRKNNSSGFARFGLTDELYFCNSGNFDVGSWYLVVGYICGAGLSKPDDDGVYNCYSQLKERSVTSKVYNWASDTNSITHSGTKIGYTSSSSSAAVDFDIYDIRLDKVTDGTPSIDDLLKIDTSTKFKGNWAESVSYHRGDVVFSSSTGCSYVCTEDHESSEELTYENVDYWQFSSTRGFDAFHCEESNSSFTVATDQGLRPLQISNYIVSFSAGLGTKRLTCVSPDKELEEGEYSITTEGLSGFVTDHEDNDLEKFKFTTLNMQPLPDIHNYIEFTVSYLQDGKVGTVKKRVSVFAEQFFSETDVKNYSTPSLQLTPSTVQIAVDNTGKTKRVHNIEVYAKVAIGRDRLVKFNFDNDEFNRLVEDGTNESKFKITSTDAGRGCAEEKKLIISIAEGVSIRDGGITLPIKTIKYDDWEEKSYGPDSAHGEDYYWNGDSESKVQNEDGEYIVEPGFEYIYNDAYFTIDETVVTGILNYTSVTGGRYLGSFDNFERVPKEVYDTDFFTWVGTNKTVTYNKKSLSLLTSKIYSYSESADTWVEDKAVDHMARALDDVLSCANEEIKANNSTVVGHFAKVVSKQVFTDQLVANQAFVNQLAANEAFIKKLTSSELTLTSGGCIKSEDYDKTGKGFILKSDGTIHATSLSIDGLPDYSDGLKSMTPYYYNSTVNSEPEQLPENPPTSNNPSGWSTKPALDSEHYVWRVYYLVYLDDSAKWSKLELYSALKSVKSNVSHTVEDGVQITTVTINGQQTVWKTKETYDGFLEVDVGRGESNNTKSGKKFYVSKEGLLQADNAIIYGTIYATNGKFTGEVEATYFYSKNGFFTNTKGTLLHESHTVITKGNAYNYLSYLWGKFPKENNKTPFFYCSGIVDTSGLKSVFEQNYWQFSVARIVYDRNITTANGDTYGILVYQADGSEAWFYFPSESSYSKKVYVAGSGITSGWYTCSKFSLVLLQ